MSSAAVAQTGAQPAPEALYLDLLKKALSFSLWPEPPAPITLFNSRRTGPKRVLAEVAARAAELVGLQLSKPFSSTEEARQRGEMWPSYAHTMVGLKRLDNIQWCAETVTEIASQVISSRRASGEVAVAF
jgi:O-methyltransferase